MTDSTSLICPISETALAGFVRFLVGSWRHGDAEDGEVVARGLKALLSIYPEWVVAAVCDPRSGLPVTSKFMPTLYEVRSACEAKMLPLRRAEERKAREREAAADRRAPISEEEAQRRRDFIANWRMANCIADDDEGNGFPSLAGMDVRRAKGAQRELMGDALDAQVARLSAKFRATPCEPLSFRKPKPPPLEPWDGPNERGVEALREMDRG